MLVPLLDMSLEGVERVLALHLEERLQILCFPFYLFYHSGVFSPIPSPTPHLACKQRNTQQLDSWSLSSVCIPKKS